MITKKVSQSLIFTEGNSTNMLIFAIYSHINFILTIFNVYGNWKIEIGNIM